MAWLFALTRSCRNEISAGSRITSSGSGVPRPPAEVGMPWPCAISEPAASVTSVPGGSGPSGPSSGTCWPLITTRLAGLRVHHHARDGGGERDGGHVRNVGGDDARAGGAERRDHLLVRGAEGRRRRHRHALHRPPADHAAQHVVVADPDRDEARPRGHRLRHLRCRGRAGRGRAGRRCRSCARARPRWSRRAPPGCCRRGPAPRSWARPAVADFGSMIGVGTRRVSVNSGGMPGSETSGCWKSATAGLPRDVRGHRVDLVRRHQRVVR